MKCYQSFGRWRDAGVPLGVWILIAVCPIPALALTQGEPDASRNLWNMSGSTDYDYFMQRFCFCFPDSIRPGLVQVRSEVITAVTDAETLQPLDPQFFLTVTGLFDELQGAIDLSAFAIEAQFDSTFGYPTNIGIDFRQEVADDEVSYTARDLRRLTNAVCDFDGNASCDLEDIDAMTSAIFQGSTDRRFDLNGDTSIDQLDIAPWLASAATENGFGETFLLGDADLDGRVNSADLNSLGISWQQDIAIWSAGDFTADGRVNSADLNAIGLNWQKSIPSAAAQSVPEPSGNLLLFVVGLFAGVLRSKNSSDKRR